ncbi:MAG: hypothetical protein AAFN51_02045 [Pseudomonadota bacterium]
MPREVLLGWRNSSPQASLAFFPPVRLSQTEDGALAGLIPSPDGKPGFADRTYVIRSPWNLRMRPQTNQQGATVVGIANQPGHLSQEAFSGLGEAFKTDAWRKADNPIFQMSLNLFFVSDEPCSVQLMPPFLSPTYRNWPGTLVCGRFPVTHWPRPVNAALEWQQDGGDWELTRGEPIAYVQAIHDDPDVIPVLVEAEMTAALKRHTQQMDSVALFARNVSPMFERAERARPAKLLKAKQLAPSNDQA